jgi:hypothetical protein
MKRLITACVLVLGCVFVSSAGAAGRLAQVALVDRDTGRQLETYYRRGEYWVAGEPGAHYDIYIRNRLGERLLAVMSVDGIDVITGESGGWNQGGYVLDPWQSYEVSGWRKSDYEVAAFSFTAAPRSYAARTGRAENVGVIGVALFRERPAPVALAGIASGEPEPAPPAPAATGRARADEAAAPLARNQALGTAHGEREYSFVVHTSFRRRQRQPDEIIRIRYDTLENLIASGIVRPHCHPGAGPNPFPGTDAHGYVPDPPPFDGGLAR